MIELASAIVTPLTKATASALKPIRLPRSTFFLVGLEGQDFEVELVTMKENESGKLVQADYLQPSWRAREFMDTRLPEAKWLGAKNYKARHKWRVGATDYTAILFRSCVDQNQIRFLGQEAALTYQMLWKRFVSQDKRSAVQAAYKLTKTLPAKPEDWFDHPTFPLSDYQRVAVQMSLGQEGTGLFMDRGTGKTATVIQRMCMEAKRLREKNPDQMMRVLVVCPNQVRLNWEQEVQKFTFLAGKVTTIRGTPEQRIRSLVQAITTEADCEFSVVIVGYDSLACSLHAFAKPGLWDLCVLDESHFIKSPSTKRWKSLLQLRDCCKHRTILTGTPVGNSLMDLWSQLEFLGHGYSGFSKFSNYRKFHGVFSDTAIPGIKRLEGTKNVPLLQERLARLTFSISKDDAGLNLPDKVYDTFEVEMTKQQRDAYIAMSEHLAAEIEDQLSGDVSAVEVENILAKLLRLAQITSGHIGIAAHIDPETGEVLAQREVKRICNMNDNPKIQACIDILKAEDRDPLGKALIWCSFTEDIRTISERLTAEGIEHGCYYGATSQLERDELVQRFNGDDSLKVLVLNPQTAGEGLNLLGYDNDSDMYCDQEIFFSQNWSAILRGQAEDRAHRRGTRMPVRITDLTVPGTIDEEIRERVQGKISMAEALTDLREILTNVLNITGVNNNV
jgi:SNF2 family DNA or RNA helicase